MLVLFCFEGVSNVLISRGRRSRLVDFILIRLAIRVVRAGGEMAGRPAGFSDSEDSDDDFFYDSSRPHRKVNWTNVQEQDRRNVESEVQSVVAAGDMAAVLRIIQNDFQGMVNTRLESNWTILHHAAQNAQIDIVKQLLHLGVDVNLHSGGTTPLMAACDTNAAEDAAVDVVTALLEAGALLNIGDMYGKTALMRACETGRARLVAVLLGQEGINVEMRDSQGWTATFYAVHGDHPETLELMMRHGARLDEVDRSGRTLRDICRDDAEVLRLLPAPPPPPPVVAGTVVSEWTDYYPVRAEPEYKAEAARILSGAGLPPGSPLAAVALQTLLVMDDATAKRLGLAPYLRQRLRTALRRLHARPWRQAAVAGLYAPRKDKLDTYSTGDCALSLGSHLLQMHVMLGTLQYALTPPRLPTTLPSLTTAKAVCTTIQRVRREAANVRELLDKVARRGLPPADLISPTVPKSSLLPKLLLGFSFVAVSLYAYRRLLT